MSPLQALLHQAATRPGAAAVVSGTDTWTFGRLADASARLAGGLAERGIRPGDRVALHLTNRVELVLGYFACFRLGAVAAPLNVRLTTPELRDLVDRLSPTLFLTEARLRPASDPIFAKVLPRRWRLVVDLPGGDGKADPFAQLLASAPPAAPPDVAAAGLTVLIPTSGTTAKPKLAAWTVESLASGIPRLDHVALGEGVTALLMTPLVHGAALTFLLASVLFGGTVVLLPEFEPDQALHLVERHGVGWVFGLPRMIASLAERQTAAPRNTGSLRTCLVAGDVSPPGLHRAFEQAFGQPLRSVLASTELGWPVLPGRAPGAVGRIPPGAGCRIVDSDGRDAAPDEVGELHQAGRDCLATGYWQGPGRIDDLAPEGWFASGDLVRLDRHGDLWFAGRVKDIIVTGGANVSPVEVEEVLLGHPAVAEAMVAGLPDERLGQRVAAAVVVAAGRTPPTADELVAHARSRLAGYKVPERVQAMASLPRSAAGKPRRAELAALLAAADPGAGRSLRDE